jgi:nitroreductase
MSCIHEPMPGDDAPPRRTMTIMDAIYGRHAVQAFTGDDVTEHAVHALLYAAAQAPVTASLSAPAFLVVQGRERLRALSGHTGRLYNAVESEPVKVTPDNDFTLFHNAGTLIVVCIRQQASMAVPEAWMAVENIMLAATGMGLGSCLIGEAVAGLSDTRGRTLIGLPDSMVPVAIIALGKPEPGIDPTERRPPDILNWLL